MPANVPSVQELGVTSAPLQSASFFIGQYCQEFNGSSLFPIGLRAWICVVLLAESASLRYIVTWSREQLDRRGVQF